MGACKKRGFICFLRCIPVDACCNIRCLQGWFCCSSGTGSRCNPAQNKQQQNSREDKPDKTDQPSGHEIRKSITLRLCQTLCCFFRPLFFAESFFFLSPGFFFGAFGFFFLKPLLSGFSRGLSGVFGSGSCSVPFLFFLCGLAFIFICKVCDFILLPTGGNRWKNCGILRRKVRLLRNRSR